MSQQIERNRKAKGLTSDCLSMKPSKTKTDVGTDLMILFEIRKILFLQELSTFESCHLILRKLRKLLLSKDFKQKKI